MRKTNYATKKIVNDDMNYIMTKKNCINHLHSVDIL